MKKILISLLVIIAPSLFAQQVTVGDTVPNFSLRICSNGSGYWSLDNYNGAKNGGDYNVIFLDIFATW